MTTEIDDADPLIRTDGTTQMARNGAVSADAATNGGISAIADINLVRGTNARREGVTRDMCEECSVLCNR